LKIVTAERILLYAAFYG